MPLGFLSLNRNEYCIFLHYVIKPQGFLQLPPVLLWRGYLTCLGWISTGAHYKKSAKCSFFKKIHILFPDPFHLKKKKKLLLIRLEIWIPYIYICCCCVCCCCCCSVFFPSQFSPCFWREENSCFFAENLWRKEKASTLTSSSFQMFQKIFQSIFSSCNFCVVGNQ